MLPSLRELKYTPTKSTTQTIIQYTSNRPVRVDAKRETRHTRQMSRDCARQCHSWTLVMLWCVVRRSCAFCWHRPLYLSPATFHAAHCRRASILLSLSSVDLDDTDDEYYARLFEEDGEDDDDVDDVCDENEDKQYQTQEVKDQDQLRDAAEWSRHGHEQLKREAVEYRKRCRNQVKRSRRLNKAKQMALEVLGLETSPNETHLAERYRMAKGVYVRLLEALDQRQKAAYERAKQFVVDREAQLAALHATNDITGRKRVSQLDYLMTIQSKREEEAIQTHTLTELVLSQTIPPDKRFQGLSDEDLIAVLRIRGNIKGIRRLKKRDTILNLLRRSFQKTLY